MNAHAPVRLFVSYSHRDKEWFAKVRPLLTKHGVVKTVHIWHDQELRAGDRWDDDIRRELKEMDIFLCLLSYNFLDSSYIMDVELPVSLAREKTDGIIIIPLHLCEMDDRDIQLLKPFNPLPQWGRSWRDFERNGGNSMDAHKPIRSGILDAVETVLRRRSTVPTSTV